MKINVLRFKNLNSLVGDFEINFSQKPFSESGIFAITGPTGAGKSTILDAICLALYHQTPRLTGAKDLEEIVSRHTYNAFSEVEFEVAGVHYCSHISLRYASKGKGKFQSPKVELSNLSENRIIETYKSKMAKKIETITGLNFDQFTRAMMLAQGAFSAFLKTNENERAALLEKMTNTGKYRKISVKIYDKTRNKFSEYEKIKSSLDSIELKSDEEIQAIVEELKTFCSEEKKLKEKLQIVQKEKTFLNEIAKLEEERKKNNKKMEDLSEKWIAAQPKLKMLKIAEELSHLETDYQIFNNLQKEIVQIERKINPLSKKVKEKERLHNEQDLIVKKNKIEYQKVKADFQNLKPKIAKAIELNVQLTEKENEIKISKEEKNNLLTGIKDKKHICMTLNKDVNVLQEEVKSNKEYLDDNANDKHLPNILGRVNEVIKQYNNIQNELKSICKKKDLINKELKIEREHYQINKKNIQEMEKKIQAFSHSIKTLDESKKSILKNKTVEEIELQIEKVQENIEVFEKLKDISVQIMNLKTKIADDKKQILIQKDQLKNVTLENETVIKEVKNYEEQKKCLEENIHLQDLVKSLAEHRKELVADKECPLCGAKNHPWGKALPVFSNKKKQLENINIVLQKKRKKKEGLLTAISRIKANKDSLDKNLDANFVRLNELKESWCAVYMPVSEKMEIKNNNEETSLILDEKITFFNTSLQKWRTILKENYALDMKIKENQEHLSQMKDQKSKQEIEKVKRSSAISNKEKKYVELIQLNDKLNSDKNEIYNTLEDVLSPYDLIFDKNNPDLVEKIENRIKKYERNEKSLSSKNNKIDALEKKITKEVVEKKALENEVVKVEKRIATLCVLKTKLRDEIILLVGTKKPKVMQENFEKNIAEFEKNNDLLSQQYNSIKQDLDKMKFSLSSFVKTLEEKTKAREQRKQNLLAKLETYDIDQISKYEDIRLTEEARSEMKALEKKLDNEKATLESNIKQNESALLKKKSDPLTTKTMQEIDEYFEELSQKQSENLKKQGELNNLIVLNTKVKKQHSEKLKMIEKYQAEYEKWDKLNVLIGSKSGDKFQKFAQGLTLQKLIILANKHLENLTNRYILVRAKNSDLELNVIDTYQANEIRPIKSLSGGESFIISLSFALGLSDLNAGKTIISSLFLDEGFGTLDSHNLETALSALENLQATGKTIGVISHVKMLKERISTQINVIKQGNGKSRIEITQAR